MTRTLLSCLVVAVLAGSFGGCVVRTRDPHHHHNRRVRQPTCHPSQYWDGHQCRHKARHRVERHR
jgi:hypothetical protein